MRRYEGLYLHPCQGKRPVLKDWPNRASRDPEQIREWFGPYRPGMLTGERNGIVVVDVDDGIEELRRLYLSIFPRPPTVVLSTRGGHVYFRYPKHEVRNAAGAIVNGIRADIRGDGGYVLVPGNGNPHRFVEGLELDVDRLPSLDAVKIERKEVSHRRIDEDDVLQRIYRATKWIEKAEPAIAGQKGHSKFFYVCCALFQKFGLTLDQAYPMILVYNSRCQPPFSKKEVDHKVVDALATLAKKGA